jgi:hypothetical protein
VNANLGEWSEAYAWLSVLADGEVKSFGGEVIDVQFVIVQGKKIYISKKKKNVFLEYDGKHCKEIEVSDFCKKINFLKDLLSNKVLKGSFESLESQSLINEFGINKVKAPLNSKMDFFIGSRGKKR